MDGYSLRDTAETLNVEHGIMERVFRNAVAAIVRQNNLQWRGSHGKVCAEVVDKVKNILNPGAKSLFSPEVKFREDGVHGIEV